MKKAIKLFLKILVGIALFLIIIVLIAFVGIKLTKNNVPVAKAPSSAKATDDRFISWLEHRIDDQALAGGLRLRGADGLEMADLDRDGYLDIVSVHEDSNHVRLAFGSGDPDKWHLITLAEGDFVNGAEDIAIGDINRDGWLDLIFACEGVEIETLPDNKRDEVDISGTIVYFQNPGSQNGAYVRNPRKWKYTIPEVVKGKGSWIRVFLADLNQDGRLEAIVTNKSVTMYGGFGSMKVPKSPVSWLEIPVNPLNAGGWVEHQLGTYLVPVNARPVDLDGDGDFDIVAGSRGECRMALFMNTSLNPLKFEEFPLEVTNRSVPQKPRLPKKLSGMVLAFADINKDNRLDIITSETPWSIVWLEQPEDWNQSWKIHPIGAAFPDVPTALTLYDINSDDRLDLLTGGYSQDPRDFDLAEIGVLHRGGCIMWFEQPENPNQPWVRHEISRRVRGMYDAFVPLDLNSDGLMDFIGTRGNSGEYDGVFWLEQRRTRKPQQVFTGARETDSKQIPPPPGFIRALSDWVLQ